MIWLKIKRISLLLVVFIISNGLEAKDYSHTEGELFKLALDIRLINKLNIYSHSLSFNSKSSNGFVKSKLVLPHRVGNTFQILTQSLFIYIEPKIVHLFSRNDWAFFIGREFAHLLLANSGVSGKELEMKCDIAGAEYAIGAGYKLQPFLKTLEKFGSSDCNSHGCPNERVKNLKQYFGIEK